jgi:sodium/hydrogen antiporter
VEHGLDTEVVAVFAAAVVVWSLVSERLDRLSLTPALAFVVVGLVVANPPLSLIEIDAGSETVRSLAEVTLAVVLFSDAARVDVRRLRADISVPLRLLLIGLPITVAGGVGLGLVLFADLDAWVCAVMAAAVAPTDAALGAPLMADRRIPARVRRELNVESGLNDGLITPVVTFFIAGAVAEAGSQPDLSPGSAVVDLALGVLVGVGLGVAGGTALRVARRQAWATSAVETLAVLALALLAYAAAVEAGGNGFVAAFVGGMAFGAARKAAADVLGFASETGELLAIVVWFVFGAIAVPVLDGAPWAVVAFAVLALSVGRMVPVAVALVGTGLSRPSVAFLGWFGPRGLASVVFALIAFDELAAGETRSTMLAAIVATVLLSVVAHALTAKPLAGRYAAYVAGTDRPAELRPAGRSPGPG